MSFTASLETQYILKVGVGKILALNPSVFRRPWYVYTKLYKSTIGCREVFENEWLLSCFMWSQYKKTIELFTECFYEKRLPNFHNSFFDPIRTSLVSLAIFLCFFVLLYRCLLIIFIYSFWMLKNVIACPSASTIHFSFFYVPK